MKLTVVISTLYSTVTVYVYLNMNCEHLVFVSASAWGEIVIQRKYLYYFGGYTTYTIS